MVERATLRLDSGDEVRVEVDPSALEDREIVVRRADDAPRTRRGLLAVVDEHLARAEPHAAGTTDRLLAVDRERSY